MPGVSHVSDADVSGFPHDVKDSSSPSSIPPYSNADAHMATVGAFGMDSSQCGHPDWSAAMQPHTQLNFDVLWIMTCFYQNQL